MLTKISKVAIGHLKASKITETRTKTMVAKGLLEPLQTWKKGGIRERGEMERERRERETVLANNASMKRNTTQVAAEKAVAFTGTDVVNEAADLGPLPSSTTSKFAAFLLLLSLATVRTSKICALSETVTCVQIPPKSPDFLQEKLSRRSVWALSWPSWP